MKKLTAIFAMALMLPMSLLFVSCDEDAEVAYHLDGAWRGNMYVKTAYGGRTYTATYSEIEFYSGYNSGTGVWVDYYSGAPYDYVANHIRWAVRDGNIYIHFVEENIDAIISNYSLGTYDFPVVWRLETVTMPTSILPTSVHRTGATIGMVGSIGASSRPTLTGRGLRLPRKYRYVYLSNRIRRES